MVATVRRIPAKSGNRDNDRFQAVHADCGWTGSLHSNRTVEGRRIAQREADQHVCASGEVA